MDVSAEVKLIDLPEGDDVDPVNVTAAHLRRNMEINVKIQPWTLERKCEQ